MSSIVAVILIGVVCIASALWVLGADSWKGTDDG